jgi:hypothetical protein
MEGAAAFDQVVSDAFFTWEPNRERAVVLARVARVFWQSNAMRALRAASDGLSEPIDCLMRAVSEIDLDRPLSPRLSARLAGLMEAMERRDGYAVYDTLQAWSADPPSTWYAQALTTESIATHAWETPLLREVRSTQISGGGPLEFFPMLERDTQGLHGSMLEALGRIETACPAMHAEISSHVSMIKLFTGNGIEGLSSPKVYGALWLKAPTLENAQSWFLEHLVHECSHLYLNAMLIVDPLLNNPQEMNKAPIRPDPRPMFQILHGTFVLARNCDVHAKLDTLYPELKLRPMLEKFREQFRNGFEVLSKHMEPTERGALLLDSLSSFCDELPKL